MAYKEAQWCEVTPEQTSREELVKGGAWRSTGVAQIQRRHHKHHMEATHSWTQVFATQASWPPRTVRVLAIGSLFKGWGVIIIGSGLQHKRVSILQSAKDWVD